MIVLFAVLYMLFDEPHEHSLELVLRNFDTTKACLRYRDSDEFAERWNEIEKKMPRYRVRFGCASEESLND